MKRYSMTFVLLMGLLVTGCAYFGQAYQKPEIHLVSIKPLPAQNLEQRFVLGLRITNPNGMALPVRGMSYKLSVNGNSILSGATASVPGVPAYGNVLVDVESGTNLLGGVRALGSIMNNPGKPFSYDLEVRLDSGLWRLPVVVNESGEIGLE